MSDEPTSTPEPPAPPSAPPPALSPPPEGTALPEATATTAERGSVWAGIGLLALLHLIQIPLFVVAGVFWIGISQLVYAVPAALILANKGKGDTARGVWIGAGITFLINGACFGILMWQLGNTNFH